MMNDVGSNNNKMDGTIHHDVVTYTCTNQSLTAPLPSGRSCS
jgi:hypothetical protein